MKQILIQRGKISVADTPAPAVQPGCVLVQVHYSCISSGTELLGLQMSALPLWKRALKQPQQVKKALRWLNQYGWLNTHSVIHGMRNSGQATGYSAAGIVVEIGAGVNEFSIGDRVACAGAQYANHAEIISVPQNLTVIVPDKVNLQEAATTTMGAIALQGVRRAAPTLGETFVVLGLGLLGQLTAQLLKANGCRVIGIDLQAERLQLATQLGMDLAISSKESDSLENVARLTDGVGCDGVIITAATASHEVIALAFQLCRKKARVVLVGNVGLNINREDIYKKELDFLVSSSYGPGRYDHLYEEKGLDYPLPYVRWTENRNMSEYLRLLANGNIQIKSLITSTYPIADAENAYATLDQSPKPLFVFLQYPTENIGLPQKTIYTHAKNRNEQQIKIALIGAGNFAKGMHLPNLNRLSKYLKLHAVMSRSSHNAINIANQFKAHYATTDWQVILDDHELNAVLITTRHHLHAQQTLQALKAGKHVLVEKPLAINNTELNALMNFFSDPAHPNKPLLLTGFNRRFSPYIKCIQKVTHQRSHPMIINYRMNAGFIAHDHWIQDKTEGAGRNIGEACHIYDLFTYFTQSCFSQITVNTIRSNNHYYQRQDNFIATINFADGSIANLIYTAMGHKEYPKELLEIFVDGKVITLQDYRSLKIIGLRGKNASSRTIQKGHQEELLAFAKAIQEGLEPPIPLWQQFQAMQIAFAVEQQLIGHSTCAE